MKPPKKFMSNGISSIFMLNIVGSLVSLLTIVVIHYIVGTIINKINKKLNPMYMESHNNVINLLKRLK